MEPVTFPRPAAHSLFNATEHDIVEAARAKSGLYDLDDTEFLQGLGQVIRSFDQEVTFTTAGAASMKERMVRIAVNRLRFAADLKAHPEIFSEELLPVVTILGLPRVGSTKLHRMLAASGSFQDMLFWQAYNPARIPGQTDETEDARIAEASAYVEWRIKTNPAAQAAHAISVHETEEETFLLEFSFESIYPMTFSNADRYYEWMLTRDGSYTYAYLGKLLKYMQWQFYRNDPKPWILKSPPNLGYESQIQRFSPNARFIMSHRDPVTIVASLSALINQSRKLYCEWTDPKAIGQWCLNEFSREIRRHMAWREANPNVQILDVAYRDVEQDPMKVVRKSYDFLDLPVTPEALSSINHWLATDSHGSSMRHEYSLEAYGLSAAAIELEFADYIRIFKPYL